MTELKERKLTKRAEELLEASDQERIAHIQKPAFISHARIQELLAEMTALMDHPQTNRMPNLLIVARSNGGKTELLKEFKTRYPAEERINDEAIYAPVVYVECPPGPNDNMFLDAALKTLGIDPRRSATSSQKIEALTAQLVKVKTKVLLLDELNSILSGSVTKQTLLLNTIKYICNQTKISIVAAGTKDALQAIASDDQLQSRFPVRLIKPWLNADSEYRNLLGSFERILPLRKASNLSNKDTAKLILGLSEGSLGPTARLIKQSAVVAIRTGEEMINEEIIRSCASANNPTQDEINAL